MYTESGRRKNSMPNTSTQSWARRENSDATTSMRMCSLCSNV